MNSQPKPRVRHDKKYLAHIRTLPCVVCGGKSVAHHLAGKENDYATVPLCVAHHIPGVHQYGVKGFEERCAKEGINLNLWEDAHRIYFNWRDHD